MKKVSLMLVFVMLLSSLFVREVQGQQLYRVIDGDTVEVLRGENQGKIRLICIDAPEMAQVGGEAAKKALQGYLSNTEGISLRIYGKGYYGRYLGAFEVPESENLNIELVRRGYAYKYPGSCPFDIKSAEDFAKENNLGLWEKSNQCYPWDFRNDKC